MRLIDADALKENIPNTSVDIFENCRNCTTLCDWQVKELIDKMPTIDAVEVVHGEWIATRVEVDGSRFTGERCSRCGWWKSMSIYNYCPNCGAKMDGEKQSDG